MSHADALVDFFELACSLKGLARTGWVEVGVPEPESVADHSYGVALLSLVLCSIDSGFADRGRCLELAVVHDLGESIVGDLTPTSGVPADEKYAREEAAMRRLSSLALGEPLVELWREYARGETREAVLVRDANLLDLALQALAYEGSGNDPRALDRFWESARARLATPAARLLFERLQTRRQERAAVR